MKEKGDIRIADGKKQAFAKLFQTSNSSYSSLHSCFWTPLLGGGATTLILRSTSSLFAIAFVFSLEMSA